MDGRKFIDIKAAGVLTVDDLIVSQVLFLDRHHFLLHMLTNNENLEQRVGLDSYQFLGFFKSLGIYIYFCLPIQSKTQHTIFCWVI